MPPGVPPNPNVIRFILPTSAASPAATFSFFTRGYKPPRQNRDIGQDIIHNQNGKFKYIYDSGPGFLEWEPFEILCDDKFAPFCGGANSQQQFNNLNVVWQNIGAFQLGTPEGVYDVYWASNPFEKGFQRFPRSVGDKIDYEITVQIQEA